MGKDDTNSIQYAGCASSPQLNELQEQFIDDIVKCGYSRNVVKAIAKQLPIQSINVENYKSMMESVQEEIRKQAGFSVQPDAVTASNNIQEENELHKREIQSRLLKVVSISSAVDVLNGLRKWFSVSPQMDREYLFDVSILNALFKTISNSQVTPALQFSVKHFFMEVFHFRESTAEVIKNNLISVFLQSQTIDLSELSQCFIEARVKDDEFLRRELIQEIDTKITKATSDLQTNSFTKLCCIYDLITAIPTIVQPTTMLTQPTLLSIKEVKRIVGELEKEIGEYHSSHSIFSSSSNQQRLFYSLALQYALDSIGVIADYRMKIGQYTNEVHKMEKELTILQTLKMEQNITDVKKNQQLRNKMIAKWKAEEDKRLYELKDLEGKVSTLLKANDILLMKEIIAHFYSICHVLKVELTLSSEFYENLKQSIRQFREDDYSLMKKKLPKKQNKTQTKKTWKPITPNPYICTIAEIQKEELAKR